MGQGVGSSSSSSSSSSFGSVFCRVVLVEEALVLDFFVLLLLVVAEVRDGRPRLRFERDVVEGNDDSVACGITADRRTHCGVVRRDGSAGSCRLDEDRNVRVEDDTVRRVSVAAETGTVGRRRRSEVVLQDTAGLEFREEEEEGAWNTLPLVLVEPSLECLVLGRSRVLRDTFLLIVVTWSTDSCRSPPVSLRLAARRRRCHSRSSRSLLTRARGLDRREVLLEPSLVLDTFLLEDETVADELGSSEDLVVVVVVTSWSTDSCPSPPVSLLLLARQRRCHSRSSRSLLTRARGLDRREDLIMVVTHI